MKIAKYLFISALVTCMLLCAGSMLAKEKKGTADPLGPSLDDLKQRADYRGTLLQTKAESMQAYAQELIAQGELGQAMDILKRITELNLPDNQETQKIVSQTYRLMGDVSHQGEEMGLRATNLYNLADAIANGSSDYVYTPGPGGETNELLGAGDTCAEATAAILPVENMSLTSNGYFDYSGDHNWREFTISSDTVVRIETFSYLPSYWDDTTLRLYASCSDPFPIYENEDSFLPGQEYMSLIEECLAAGTYYVDVTAYYPFGTNQNFDLIITLGAACTAPVPLELDEYEPDNYIADANKIGFRNNGVGEGNQYGRDNKNIQLHSLYPNPGYPVWPNTDYVKFGLARANFVRVETMGMPGENPDTWLIAGELVSGMQIADNDDKAPGTYTSTFAFCLPEGDYYIGLFPYYYGDEFWYNAAVDVEHPCSFETEPNETLEDANFMETGTNTIYGISLNNTFPTDNDIFTFTLTEACYAVVETVGADCYWSDTLLVLADSSGATIAYDYDGGEGYCSKVEANLDAGTYYVAVRRDGTYVTWSFVYGVMVTCSAPPAMEVEPNDTCATANAAAIGDAIMGSITAGDLDHFMLTVPEDMYVEIESSGASGDSVIEVWSADGSTFIGCDDDGGAGLFSLFECCLPAGDYCVVMRGYSAYSTISSYTIEFRNGGTCTPGAPLVCPSTGLGCP